MKYPARMCACLLGYGRAGLARLRAEETIASIRHQFRSCDMILAKYHFLLYSYSMVHACDHVNSAFAQTTRALCHVGQQKS